MDSERKLTAHDGSLPRNSCWARMPCVKAARERMTPKTLIVSDYDVEK
jgi:hypothetical protein